MLLNVTHYVKENILKFKGYCEKMIDEYAEVKMKHDKYMKVKKPLPQFPFDVRDCRNFVWGL